MDGVEAELRPLEEAISNVEDKLKDSMDLIGQLNHNLTQVGRGRVRCTDSTLVQWTKTSHACTGSGPGPAESG